MFDKSKITYNPRKGQFICRTECNSQIMAQEIQASFTMCAKKIVFTAEIYYEGKTAFVGAPKPEDVIKIIDIINREYFGQRT